MDPDLAPRLIETRDGRLVGYRRAGNGPPVALLHASPRSAAVLLPLARALCGRFTVFAFDTPGFGWSDPLPLSRPDAEDYADALTAAFDALGIAGAPVYGSHTGAAIAAAAAQRHPDRVPAVVLDGLALFGAAETADYLASYLEPFRPDWAGMHLAWLWGRVRDQFTEFPWHHRADYARLPRALPPPDALQAVAVDFLAAGDNYRPAYAAAFRFDGAAVLPRLAVPATVIARSDDLLFGHLDRLPAGTATRPLGPDPAAWAQEVGALLARGTLGEPPPPPSTGAHDLRRVPDGVVAVARHGGGPGRPIALLPGIPGSARALAPLARALAQSRPVLAIDLPGAGASSLPANATAADIAGAIRAALGPGPCDVVGIEESDGIGAPLAVLCGGRLVLADPVPDGARGEVAARIADLTPRDSGAHLHAAWHQLRDTRLWRPWFRRDPAHAIPAGSDPDAAAMQAVLTDWMRGGTASAATLAASMAEPLSESLPPLSGRVAFVLRPGHPWSEAAADLAVRCGARTVTASADPRARAAAILAALPA